MTAPVVPFVFYIGETICLRSICRADGHSRAGIDSQAGTRKGFYYFMTSLLNTALIAKSEPPSMSSGHTETSSHPSFTRALNSVSAFAKPLGQGYCTILYHNPLFGCYFELKISSHADYDNLSCSARHEFFIRFEDCLQITSNGTISQFTNTAVFESD